MFALFIAGIVLLIVGALLFLGLKKSKPILRTLIPSAVGLAAVAMMIGSCVRTIPTGHTGILTVFGKVKDNALEAGVHFCAPWESVVNMDNRNQKASVDLLCFSSDIQEVSVTYTINYQISKQNAQMIYKEIGISYYDTVITPSIQEAVKSEFARYTAEELLNNRSKLSGDIRSTLTDKLSTYNIEVIDSSIENLDFSDVFTEAVEAKQVAEQRSKQAQIEQDQKTMEAEQEATRAEIQAKADAAVAQIAAEADLEVVKIQADAAEYAGEKDAAIIRQIRDVLSKNPEAITDEDVEHLLLYYYILQWNGELPQTYFSTEDFYRLLASLGESGSSAGEGTAAGGETVSTQS